MTVRQWPLIGLGEKRRKGVGMCNESVVEDLLGMFSVILISSFELPMFSCFIVWFVGVFFIAIRGLAIIM